MIDGTQSPARAVDYDPFGGDDLLLVAPATDSQSEIWAAAQMGSNASCAFNESNTIRLRGPIDVDTLRVAFADLVARHESLRTTFSRDGQSLLVARLKEVEIPLRDLSELPQPDREAALAALLAREVEDPFDLESGPLVRAAIIRLEAAEHWLVFTLHHIICDGWSTGVLVRELSAGYRARRSGTTLDWGAPYEFSSYAREQLEAELLPAHAEAEAYWLEQFTGSIPTLDLPADFPRPPIKTYHSARVEHVIDADTVAELKRVGARYGGSLFAVLLAGFAALLHRLAGEEELVIATPWAGQATSGHSDLVGHCVNTLPIRCRVEAADPFADLLGRVRTTLLDASEHSEYTLGSLLRKLPLARDPGRLPLVSVLFNLDQGIEPGDLDFGEVTAEFASNPRSYENFDLFLNAVECDGAVRIECQFNTDLMRAETLARWLTSLETLLRSASADPGRPVRALDILSEEEREQLTAWNRTESDYQRGLQVHQLVEEQAAQRPEQIALVCDGEQLTYAELDRCANRLARRLRGLGVQRGMRVGLCLERTPAMVMALLAVSKAGGAYVPLDPLYPRERLEYMIRDSGLGLVIAQESTRDVAPSGVVMLSVDGDREAIGAESAEPLAAEGRSTEDVLYVIYTSGSTGRPKGVMVPHRAVANLLASAARTPGIEAEDVVVAVTTLAFDIAVYELWLPLSVGARVVLASREVAADGELLAEVLRKHGASFVQATPATWRLLLGAGWEGSPKLKVLCGGEALPGDLAKQLVARAAEVWNMYGPTETTVWSSCYRVPGSGGPVLIGGPIANTQFHVLDRYLRPVPIGVPGELYIGGEGVTLGYLERPELTADRFLPDPFRTEPGARLYRTGDVARWRPDGNVEYLGRNDHQVKIRGYRIELGEVEAALVRHPAVAQAVAVARELGPGDVRLVAYLVPQTGSEWSESELRAHLRRGLPDYMVPLSFVRLEALPLTANGKIDRKALPAPEWDGGEASDGYVAPSTDAERLLAVIWQDVLLVGRIGIHDDFFRLGGHSLLAAQVIARLVSEHGIAVPMRQIFETPTIAAYAAALAAAPAARSIPRRSGEGPAPASILQRRFWLIDQLGLAPTSLSAPAAWRLKGTIDMAALERALHAFVGRHDVVRTTLHPYGDDVVQVVATSLQLDLTPIDLSALPASEREGELVRRLQIAADEPFDLARGPLFRVALYRLAEDEHVLFQVVHHAIWDGWTFDIFLHEIDVNYRAFAAGRESPLKELRVQYADFASWQRRLLDSPEVAPQVAYWQKQLTDEVPLLELASDRPRVSAPSHAGDTEWVEIPHPEVERLTTLGRQEGSTLSMVTLAAFSVLLHRYSGQDDFFIGTPVRGRVQPELEELAGPLINDLLLRARFEGDPTFLEVLRSVRANMLDAFTHQDVPFDAVGIGRSQAYRASFSFQDARRRPSAIGDLGLGQVHILSSGVLTDVGLWLMEKDTGLVGGLAYSTELFDRETMRRFLGSFRKLLQEVVAKPGRPVSELEVAPGAPEVAAGSGEAVDRLLHESFEHHARQRPEAIAVMRGSSSLTYGELDDWAGRLAAQLRGLGVGPGKRVAICAQPGIERVVALVAASKSGGAAVLLDPAHPAARLRRIAEKAGAQVFLHDGRAIDQVAVLEGTILAVSEARSYESEPGHPSTIAAPDDVALVAATSGPNGEPLAVELTHRALATAIEAAWKAAGLTEADRLVATAEVASGRSVMEVWLALGGGASLVPASGSSAADRHKLRGVIEAAGATAMHAEPHTWRFLLEAGWRGSRGFTVLCSGGLITAPLAERLADAGGRACAYYGLAETGFWCGATEITGAGSAGKLGKPLGDARWYIVDGRLEPVPPGAAGELLVGGYLVATSYTGSLDLTATRFVTDPFGAQPAGHLVRTGDRARERADGSIEILARADGRLAMRGLRVEPAEVEAALMRHPAVQTAAVMTDESWDERLLVAYIVTRRGEDYTDTELRRLLRGALPEAMVPRRYVEVDALPRHSDGTVDRSRLLASGRRISTAGRIEPRTDVERLLAKLWREALGTAQVGVHDNFFDLGGHSLLCIQVIAQIEDRTGIRLRPRILLLNTLEQVAAQLSESGQEGPLESEPVRSEAS